LPHDSICAGFHAFAAEIVPRSPSISRNSSGETRRFPAGPRRITQVFERLFLGCADDAERLANSLGICAVVNVGTEKDQGKHEGILYI
jgi:hypothetical protein